MHIKIIVMIIVIQAVVGNEHCLTLSAPLQTVSKSEFAIVREGNHRGIPQHSHHQINPLLKLDLKLSPWKSHIRMELTNRDTLQPAYGKLNVITATLGNAK